MSNFTSTTGHFFHYIESVFLVHHYYYNQNIESVFLLHHYYDKNHTFDVLIYLWRQKRSQRRKSKYQLPMAYYLWLPRPVEPWGVRLGSIRLGWVRLGSIVLCLVRLG
jgi:hypothetical protein